MNRLVSVLLILTQLIPTVSFGAITPPDRADLGGFINSVTNSSGQRGLAGWTKSGSPTFSVDSGAGNKAAGISSFALDAGSASDYVETLALTLTDDTTGDCEASVSVKGNATGYTLQLMNGSTVLNSVALTNNTGFKAHGFNYSCGSGYKLRIASSGDNAAINFGAVYWGKATNLLVASGPSSEKAFVPTGTWNVNINYTGSWSQIADKARIRYAWSLIGRPNAATVLTLNMPSGFVIDTAKLPGGAAQGSVLGTGTFLRNGIQVVQIQAQALSTTTIGIFPIQTTGSASYIAGQGAQISTTNVYTWDAGDLGTIDIEVPIVGWTSGAAIKPDQSVSAIGEVFPVATASCPAGSLPADGRTMSAAEQAAYPELYAALGSTWGGVGKLPNMSGAFPMGTGSQSFGGVTYDGSTVGTYLADKMQGHRHGQFVPSTAGGASVWGLSFWNASRTSATTLDSSFQTVGDPNSDGTNGTPRAGTVTKPFSLSFTWCVRAYAMKAPVVVNGVSNSSTSGVRIEAASVQITGASTCIINYQIGSWISSVTAGGSACTLNFTPGAFQVAPFCFATSFGGGNNICRGLGALPTTTSWAFAAFNTSSVPQNDACMIFCIGQR